MMRRVAVEFDPEIDARGYDRMRSAMDRSPSGAGPRWPSRRMSIREVRSGR